MKNNLINEQDFFTAFEIDSKSKLPPSSVKSRLLYYFQIRSLNYKIKQNSFSGMLAWFFSFKNLTIKATFASLIIAFSLIKFQGNNPSSGQYFIDSLANKNEAYIDSAMLLPFNNDTCFLKL